MNNKIDTWDLRIVLEQELSTLAERILENNPLDDTPFSTYPLIDAVMEGGQLFKEELKKSKAETGLTDGEIDEIADEVVKDILKNYITNFTQSSTKVKILLENEVTMFINKYGRQECGKIMQTLNDSKLFNENIEIAMRKNHVPDSKVLNGIISSCSYKLAFAKQRKVNFASLYFLLILYNKLEVYNLPINENAFMNSFHSITFN